MSTRRGRPPGPALLPAEDLRTPGIGQFFHQQPFAPIFQQRMGGGASQGAGSQHDHVDLTGGSGESWSEDVTSVTTSSFAQNNTPAAAETRDSLQQFLATYSDSGEEDAAPSSEHPPSTAGPSPPTQMVDAFHDSDSDEGGDSEDMDSAAAGPSGEYSQKRGAPVPRGDCRSRRVGKRRKA